MKKFLLFFVMAAVLTAAAFADHPENKFGIGPTGGWYGSWDSAGSAHAALNLKIPHIPVFWTVYLGFGSNHFFTGVSGDVYIIEKDLVHDISLHWFVGAGGWVNIGFGASNDFSLGDFSLGIRVPIGLSWHVLNFLELFFDVAPSLGIKVIPEFHFPAGGWPIEIGVRFWL